VVGFFLQEGIVVVVIEYLIKSEKPNDFFYL